MISQILPIGLLPILDATQNNVLWILPNKSHNLYEYVNKKIIINTL